MSGNPLSSVSNPVNSERVETPGRLERRAAKDDRIGQAQYPDHNARIPEHNQPLIAHPLNATEHLELAVLRMLDDPSGEQPSILQKLSRRHWNQLLQWLDSSGIALYFFSSFRQWHHIDILPDLVRERLQLNLSDNFVRTRSLTEESVAIQHEFQQLSVRYAVIKGISLWPHSVPDPALRSQLDLDFLVAEDSAPIARSVLERKGYRLYAATGSSWEFKCNERPGISIKDLYKDSGSWAVELHIEPAVNINYSRLEWLEMRELCGMRMPTLSSVDSFIGQGLHVYKNVCAEFLRAAHVWEFRNAVRSRRHDTDFWNAVRAAAIDNQSVSIRLGVVLLLITEVLGEFAPDSLTYWTVPLVPTAARIWIRIYGHRSVLGKFPGNKRYLFLQRELEKAGVCPRRKLVESLIPTRFPPPIIRPLPNESPAIRFARSWMQLKFITQRLRFHLIAGLDYRRESRLWRKATREIEQSLRRSALSVSADDSDPERLH